jgi:hypothetical protein
MGPTHDNLAVQAFKRGYGRAPARLCEPDEAWIQAWIADHVSRLCRQKLGYARYYALMHTRHTQKVAKLRLNAVRRKAALRP